MSSEHELSVTCHIAAPRERVWKMWVDRKEDWFCPKPWRAEVIEEDLRPGGRSAVRMFGPDGEDTGPMEGVFLEVVLGETVVTTDAYASGWVPQTPFLTAIWHILHKDEPYKADGYMTAKKPKKTKKVITRAQLAEYLASQGITVVD